MYGTLSEDTNMTMPYTGCASCMSPRYKAVVKRDTHFLTSAPSDFVLRKTRSTRDRSTTHSLQIRGSTKSPISRLLFVFQFHQ